MNEDISKAVAVFRTSPNLQDYAVYKVLIADGVERQLAARLVEFLPIVYCRLILRNSGARFSNTFRRTLTRGTSYEQPLASEPIWNAAVAFAYAEVERGVSSQDLLAVATRSAEFDTANQLLNKGSKLENIAFTPPVLNWPESGPNAESQPVTPQRGSLQ
jgi:hypothetical protein